MSPAESIDLAVEHAILRSQYLSPYTYSSVIRERLI